MYTVWRFAIFTPISPRHSSSAKRFVSQLVQAAEALSPAERAGLVTRYEHLYGELSGQRALSESQILEYLDYIPPTNVKRSFVIALETYFGFACNLLSILAIDPGVGRILRKSRSTDVAVSELLISIASGSAHVERGLSSYADSFGLDWFVEAGLDAFVDTAHQISIDIIQIWRDELQSSKHRDPLQLLHHEIFPDNLVHVTGQFYTPPWLCELLVEDVAPKKEGLILDPFCGSGAFLLAGLRHLRHLGVDIVSATRQVFGIDLSPSACIAARTNIILYAAQEGVKNFSSLWLNILCADTLAPAVVRGRMAESGLFQADRTSILVDGESVDIDPHAPGEISRVCDLLFDYGIATDLWAAPPPNSTGALKRAQHNPRERRIAEQLFVFMMRPADTVLTNPPWVGWEYMARPYRDYLNPAWTTYGLFEQKGLAASFLKEDLSTLAMVTACDSFLKDGGECGAVLRPAAMQSELAARGLRRLSIYPDRGPLSLTQIRTFDGLQLFSEAAAPGATWQLTKGIKPTFPVPVISWERKQKRWQPDAAMLLEQVREGIREEPGSCQPAISSDVASRWMIGDRQIGDLSDKVSGSSSLKPRIGFFTGGANSIFYMEALDLNSSGTWRCRNIVERSKKPAPQVCVELEADALATVIRGRDLTYWGSEPRVWVVCPHTRETKMYPLPEDGFEKAYPLAHSYLSGSKRMLEDRGGFAGWEKRAHKQYYYMLQRIGEYTFSPYKVCWNYISDDFVVAVVGKDSRGKPTFPNDKVVFIPFDDEYSAHFTGGILSSSPVRLSVISAVSSRQVSASAIKHLNIPEFDQSNVVHRDISSACREGHLLIAQGHREKAIATHADLDQLVANLYGLSASEMDAARSALKKRLRSFPFSRERAMKISDDVR